MAMRVPQSRPLLAQRSSSPGHRKVFKSISRIRLSTAEDTNLSKKLGWSLCLLALAICAGSLPAAAGSTLYSNLGPSGNEYQCCTGWTISGTGTLGFSQSIAEEFQVSASGNVGQIDAGIGYVEGLNAFNILLVQGNDPTGAVLGQWDNLASPQSFGGCCGLISITGISGITLNTGTNYWLIAEPTSLGSTLWGAWNLSNSANGQLDFSTDGGVTWNDGGVTNQGAFDILGGGGGGTTPEPSSLLLLGTGVVGAFGVIRRKLNR